MQTGSKEPDAAVTVLHKSAYSALANPEVKKQLEGSSSYTLAPMSIAELNAFYAKEAAMYRAIAKSINLETQLKSTVNAPGMRRHMSHLGLPPIARILRLTMITE